MPKSYFFFILISVACASLNAQDPFFTHYFGNESIFNPAFTGKRGAVTLKGNYRSQWGEPGQAAPYEIFQATLEESVPCFFLDWGLGFTHAKAGEGPLEINQIEFRAAIHGKTFPISRDGLIDLRAGFSIGRGDRSLDWEQLVYLDQYDALYGLVGPSGANQTAFAPGTTESTGYWTNSIGIAGRLIGNTGSGQSLTADVGVAIHNWGGLSSIDDQQSPSLLGQDLMLGERYVFAANVQIPVHQRTRDFWALAPAAMFQTQEGLQYLEVGMDVVYKRDLRLGIYAHAAQFEYSQANTNWVSLRANFGKTLIHGYDSQASKRIDFGVALNINSGGLGNLDRPSLEFTAALSFGGKSPSCSLSGSSDDGRYEDQSQRCYQFNVSGARDKIYDQIWYEE
ncbi:MAG: type IX secretion system membrane protein PorP/SprF [Bacteroidota bacterium]